MSALIDIPFPEDCNHCLICSLIPELPKRELREKGIQYRLYCKVTGECVSGVGRGEDCPLHECKTGKWIVMDDMDDRISGICSVCGWEAHLYEDDVVGMDFCPNCGARLEVKE